VTTTAPSATVSGDRWPRPLVAVDVAAFTVLEADLKLLLVRRALPPHLPALPGGFVRCGDVVVDQGEDLQAAARRELVEETRLFDGVGGARVRLIQVGAFGAPYRDPRARVIAVAWLALVRPEVAAFVRAGSDAAAVEWRSVAALALDDEGGAGAAPLAFDHRAVALACLQRLRRDIDATDVARELVPAAFSVAELRAVVDAVRGTPADPANFRRRFSRLVEDGVVVAAAGHRVTGRRHAQVWSFTADGGRVPASSHGL
jgi:8-oxo-dGTP diphosphatase